MAGLLQFSYRSPLYQSLLRSWVALGRCASVWPVHFEWSLQVQSNFVCKFDWEKWWLFPADDDGVTKRRVSSCAESSGCPTILLLCLQWAAPPHSTIDIEAVRLCVRTRAFYSWYHFEQVPTNLPFMSCRWKLWKKLITRACLPCPRRARATRNSVIKTVWDPVLCDHSQNFRCLSIIVVGCPNSWLSWTWSGQQKCFSLS